MREDLIPRGFIGKLDHAQEECAEVIKAISKMRRFGYNATDPETGISYDNVADIREEIRDAIGALTRLDQCFEHALPSSFTFPMGDYDPTTQRAMLTIAEVMDACAAATLLRQ